MKLTKLINKTKNNLSKGCTTKEKHDIIYACFETNYFCMILSGWVCTATIFVIIQFALQKIIQNKLQKLFKYKCNNNIIKNNKNKSLTFQYVKLFFYSHSKSKYSFSLLFLVKYLFSMN